MARLNFIFTIEQPDQLQNLSYDERPSWFRKWEKTGLLKYEDKNNDGLIQGFRTSNEMVRVDRDIIVLANPEIAKLPPRLTSSCRWSCSGPFYRSWVVTCNIIFNFS